MTVEHFPNPYDPYIGSLEEELIEEAERDAAKEREESEEDDD